MNRCTIVMYHYVRAIRRSRYPEIKGLELEDFYAQVEYMQQHHRFVTMQDMVMACQGTRPLPKNAALLSFDDGYSDHYHNAFPFLKAKGIQGFFFPPAAAIRHHRVLDVNKIHFVLASGRPIDEILDSLYKALDRHRVDGHELMANEELFAKHAQAGRFDPPKVAFVKRLLQRELPLPLRALVIDQLFRAFVTTDQEAFAKELYVSMEQLQEMRKAGMVIGNHGFDHLWMDRLDPVAQAREVQQGLHFLADLGVCTERWIMCYPYGAHNASLRSICKEKGCVAGLTTEVDIASVHPHSAMSLPRLDTNDLPKLANSRPGKWTKRALA